MDYAKYKAKNLPLGYGATKPSCKTVITKRLPHSGIRWKERVVLSVIFLDKFMRLDQFVKGSCGLACSLAIAH